nr:flagellar hook capping FlgD N-terminal domain-containing protein [uncultured Aminipila sp.]
MADTTINDKILSSLKALKTDKSKSTSGKADLNMQTMDWLTLLVAQLKNQDMNNTTDTSEMTSQMAQYSQIQAMNDMVSMQEEIYASNNTSYATSLLGKNVTVASIETSKDSTGKTTDKLITTKGVISGVTLFEGEPIIYIGDKKFSLSQIMIVGEVPEKDNTTDPKPTDPGTDDPKPTDPGTDDPKPTDSNSGS